MPDSFARTRSIRSLSSSHSASELSVRAPPSRARVATAIPLSRSRSSRDSARKNAELRAFVTLVVVVVVVMMMMMMSVTTMVVVVVFVVMEEEAAAVLLILRSTCYRRNDDFVMSFNEKKIPLQSQVSGPDKSAHHNR